MLKKLHFFSCFLVPLLLTGQTFSLESALSAPYCSDLVTSPDGKKIAWTINEKGIRTLYWGESPLFEPVSVYQSSYDDGQVIGNVSFDHKANHLYFVQGSGTNNSGEIANPASEVLYPKRILYQANLLKSHIDSIGNYSEYAISPDDTYLLFTAGSKLIKYDLVDRKAEPIIEMRGRFSNISFKQDGSSIVFVSGRGDHSFIGFYRFGEKQIQWIAPSIYYDRYPVWSPDGDEVAFIRSPGRKKGELDDITGGHRFSLMIFSIASQEIEEVWASPADDGGFAQYYHDEPLRWAKTGQLLFYSEHEGFMKIYQLDRPTGQATSLIDGDCEVEYSHVSASGDQILFSSNCGDIDRRHLYLYNLRAGSLLRITQGETIETNPFILEDGAYVYRKASFNAPMAVVVMSKGIEQTIHPERLPEQYPVSAFVRPKQIVFNAADGTTVHGQLFVRDEVGRKPGLLFMHGGPIRQMLLGYHYSEYYANAYVLNQYLANQGYAVMSVNYRAGTGYGKAFRRATGQGPRGASEYQDIVAGAKYLQGLNYVDPDKVGLWGGSYGGLLTAQGLARNSDIFKAGVDFHGVHDWSWRATDFSKGGFWGITDELMQLAYQSSPVADIKDWKSPVLLIHGDDDRNVMFGQSVDLAERLKDRNVHFEVLVFPDEVHGFYRYDSWLRSYRATADFFNRFLK